MMGKINIEKLIKEIKLKIIIVFVVLIVIFNSVTTVPTGYVGVKIRFGRLTNSTISEGMNLKIPFIEKIVKIDCKTQKIETTTEASSKDLQTVKISIVVNYNVKKETANTLYQQVGLDYENVIINPAMLEAIKQAAAQYTAEELVTKRANVSNEIQEILSKKIIDTGFVITEFNITNIDFSEEYDKAIEAKAVKQQEVETAKAELEKQKIENEREISKAEKDAKVMELQNNQITDKTLALKKLEVQEKMINKWNGELSKYSLGNANALLNLGE